AEIAKLEALLPTLDYGADGVVVKVNQRALHTELGTVGDREPRWAVARKFAPEVQITKLLDIRINVGRTGALNPYAVLEPVEIGGLGYERVRALLNAGIIENVADLYDRERLDLARLLTLDGFAEKSAQQLVDAIDASKSRPLSTLLFGLGIRHVGAAGAKLLARQFGSMTRLAKATADEIGRIRGIGEAIAEAVAGFFAEPRTAS